MSPPWRVPTKVAVAWHSRNRDRQVTRAGHARTLRRTGHSCTRARAREVNLEINSWKMGKHWRGAYALNVFFRILLSLLVVEC